MAAFLALNPILYGILILDGVFSNSFTCISQNKRKEKSENGQESNLLENSDSENFEFFRFLRGLKGGSTEKFKQKKFAKNCHTPI